MPLFDVTLAGELNLDLILYGLPEELIRERELLADGMMLTLGSSSAIMAHNFAVLGGRAGFVSRIGGDPLGEIALERLRSAGVDVSKVKRTSNSALTGLSVILQYPANRNILTYPGTIFDLRFEDLDLEYLSSSRHFHLSSFFLQRGLRPHMTQLFREMKAAGLSTSLDTNDDPEDKWEGVREVLKYVDVLLLNEREAKKLAGTDDLPAAINVLAELLPLVVVKLGARGALARHGPEEFTSAAVSVNAIDPVGAGDSFDAGFLLQYVRSASLENCLKYGNLAGAHSTTQPGGTEAFRDAQRTQHFFREHGTPA
jgi:sugar/nucleoside kinase (ribokinase family)